MISSENRMSRIEPTSLYISSVSEKDQHGIDRLVATRIMALNATTPKPIVVKTFAIGDFDNGVKIETSERLLEVTKDAMEYIG